MWFGVVTVEASSQIWRAEVRNLTRIMDKVGKKLHEPASQWASCLPDRPEENGRERSELRRIIETSGRTGRL